MAVDNDTAIKSANAGRGVGVCVLAGFGALWLYNALVLSHAPQWILPLMWAATAALALGGIIAIRRSKAAGYEVPRDPAVAKWFWIVFAAEFAGIAAVVVVFQMWSIDRYIVPAIAVIVGVHFLPLAQLFRAPIYYLTGIAMVAWSVTMIFAMPIDPQRTIMVAYGAGAILWASAFIVLAFPRR